MEYPVELTRRAEKSLTGLPRRDRHRIVRAIDNLSKNPRPVECEPIEFNDNIATMFSQRSNSANPEMLKNAYRLSVGSCKIVYVVLNQVVVVGDVKRQ